MRLPSTQINLAFLRVPKQLFNFTGSFSQHKHQTHPTSTLRGIHLERCLVDKCLERSWSVMEELQVPSSCQKMCKLGKKNIPAWNCKNIGSVSNLVSCLSRQLDRQALKAKSVIFKVPHCDQNLRQNHIYLIPECTANKFRNVLSKYLFVLHLLKYHVVFTC